MRQLATGVATLAYNLSTAALATGVNKSNETGSVSNFATRAMIVAGVANVMLPIRFAPVLGSDPPDAHRTLIL
jgi:hypothetical protein